MGKKLYYGERNRSQEYTLVYPNFSGLPSETQVMSRKHPMVSSDAVLKTPVFRHVHKYIVARCMKPSLNPINPTP